MKVVDPPRFLLISPAAYDRQNGPALSSTIARSIGGIMGAWRSARMIFPPSTARQPFAMPEIFAMIALVGYHRCPRRRMVSCRVARRRLESVLGGI